MIDSIDPRWTDLADILVEYSTGVKEGDSVLILMRELHTYHLARAVAGAAAVKGARAQVLFTSAELEGDLMRFGTMEMIHRGSGAAEAAMKWADVCVDLRGAHNLAAYSGISPERMTGHRKAEGRLSALRTSTTRWVIVRVPSPEFAQQAGKSFDAVMGEFFTSVLLDWEYESEKYHQLAKVLEGAKEIRIETPDTKLVMSTEGRTYLVEDGHINMPGGEVMSSPVEDSVNGIIAFEEPAVYWGELVYGLKLEFRNGRVVDFEARTNQDLMYRLLDMDEGARGVGEFAFGVNRRITGFAKDILLDEKIFGTVHIALGRSYAECGGKNQSALHWDIIKDIRRGGKVLVDGIVVLEDGRYPALDLA
ncbi:MAG: aminopeptidase [Spirochaetales bacterium]|nr:aminopeptidase [Spirochaetales bacterium]MCF7936995.1 aminopeptidase [Spirochaetales bacterium]